MHPLKQALAKEPERYVLYFNGLANSPRPFWQLLPDLSMPIKRRFSSPASSAAGIMGAGAWRLCLFLMSLSSIFAGIFANPIKTLCFLELLLEYWSRKLPVEIGAWEGFEVSMWSECERLLLFNKWGERLNGLWEFVPWIKGLGLLTDCFVSWSMFLPKKMISRGGFVSVLWSSGGENSKKSWLEKEFLCSWSSW